MQKTAHGLADYCRAQLGRPYWWGCFGQISNAALLAAKRQQYPSQYKAADFQQQFGKKVHDCSGLVKGYLWSDGPDAPARYNRHQDTNVEGLYHHCANHGAIDTLPEVPGTLLFRSDMGHVGVYVGTGKVIEARGHAYGVCETALRDGNWAKWGQLDWIDYSTQPEPQKPAPAPDPQPQPPAPAAKPAKPSAGRTMCSVPVTLQLPLLRSGDKGDAVRFLQHILLRRGYDIGSYGIDGHFGGSTCTAVKQLQRKYGLSADGICGQDTWTVLCKAG